MTTPLHIRPSTPTDWPTLQTLYPKAFPDEELLPLVKELLQDDTLSTSLVGTINNQVVSHILLTNCTTDQSKSPVALLGPLAVSPAHQKQGNGTALIKQSLQSMNDQGKVKIVVLGDPAYYSRHGFSPESQLSPPYALPPEWYGAWQSQSIGDIPPPCTGTLIVPKPWQHKALWLP